MPDLDLLRNLSDQVRPPPSTFCARPPGVATAALRRSPSQRARLPLSL